MAGLVHALARFLKAGMAAASLSRKKVSLKRPEYKAKHNQQLKLACLVTATVCSSVRPGKGDPPSNPPFSPPLINTWRVVLKYQCAGRDHLELLVQRCFSLSSSKMDPCEQECKYQAILIRANENFSVQGLHTF